MMTAIRVRMPAPLQFVPHDHLDLRERRPSHGGSRSLARASRSVDDRRDERALRARFVGSIIAHLDVRYVDAPLAPERVWPARGERMRVVAAAALGCLLVGCGTVDRVTEPLTSPPPLPTVSSGPVTTAVEDPAIAIET